jgi:hypothetical protein
VSSAQAVALVLAILSLRATDPAATVLAVLAVAAVALDAGYALRETIRRSR